MKHRWLIRSFFITLLVLCIGAWVWSYPFRERVGYTGRTGYQEWVCEIGGGGVFVGRHWGFTGTPGWEYLHLGKDNFPDGTDGSPYLLGFRFFSSPPPPAGLGSFAIVPFWFMTALSTAALVFVWRKTGKPKPLRAFPVEIDTMSP